MPCRSILAGSVLLALVVGSTSLAGSPAPEPLLLGPDYPIEVGISLPAALLHWLDSLAGVPGPGVTAGKTVEAHRGEYVRLFGPLDPNRERALVGFAEARVGLARRLPAERRDEPTLAFLDAADVDSALIALGRIASADELASIRAAVECFEPRYRRIWSDGAAARRFVARVVGDGRRERVAAFLVGVARFYGVPPDAPPRPRIVPVPVAAGYGTHAQAIGRHLLIEIRPGEGLIEEVAPIVHENAHFLFYRIGPGRRDELASVAEGLGEVGGQAWGLLHEALPTAIAQGVAAERFQDGFSLDDPWYHLAPVDAYAKRIFPLVREALRGGGRFDETFVSNSVALLDDDRSGSAPTRRSP